MKQTAIAASAAVPLEDVISRHLVQVSYADLPEQARAAAKASILDSLGIMLATTTCSDEARILVDMAKAAGGAEESTVLGFGWRLPVAMAAFANGALGHPLDFDDTHEPSICHPTAAVLPAALAAAEVTPGVTGEEFIAAVAASVDFVCRLGLALDVAPPQHGWITSVTCGYFGAVAAAGKIMRLTPDELKSAFGIALCQIGGSQEMGRGQSDVRAIRDAFTQQVGITAVMLAKRGLKGPEQFLEGAAGFFNQYFDGKYTGTRLLDGLGHRYEGINMSYKIWPCCRLTHTYIGSLINLMAEHGLGADDIQEVRAVVSSFSVGNCEPIEQRRKPHNAMFAKYSIPFVLGVAMCRGTVEIKDFQSEGLENPNVLRAAAKVTYVVDPSIPNGAFSAGNIEVTTTDGRKFQHTEPYALGSPQNPMTLDDLHRKFRDCLSHAVNTPSRDEIDDLIAFIMNLERAETIGRLFGTRS